MSVSQKVVLVTGCSQGGIGFSMYAPFAVLFIERLIMSRCQEYAWRGCKVYATARKFEAMEGLEHPNIKKLVLDVTKADQIEDVVSTVVTGEGKIDILVNNAGALRAGASHLRLPYNERLTKLPQGRYLILQSTKQESLSKPTHSLYSRCAEP